jgi:hypothetical protein
LKKKNEVEGVAEPCTTDFPMFPPGVAFQKGIGIDGPGLRLTLPAVV